MSIIDRPQKVVYARQGNRLYVVDWSEMVGWNREIPDRAVNELAGGFATMSSRIGNFSHTERLSSWADFSPATPTDVPIAESSPLRNLYLNDGLDNFGWTPVCGSAALLAQQIGGS